MLDDVYIEFYCTCGKRLWIDTVNFPKFYARDPDTFNVVLFCPKCGEKVVPEGNNLESIEELVLDFEEIIRTLRLRR